MSFNDQGIRDLNTLIITQYRYKTNGNRERLYNNISPLIITIFKDDSTFLERETIGSVNPGSIGIKYDEGESVNSVWNGNHQLVSTLAISSCDQGLIDSFGEKGVQLSCLKK